MMEPGNHFKNGATLKSHTSKKIKPRNMKTLQVIKGVLLSLIIPILWGCGSDKLSRGNAEKLIKEIHKFPYEETMPFNIAFSENKGGWDNRDELKQLQDEGLLTYHTNPGSWGYDWYEGDLTENGKQYAVSGKYKQKNQFGIEDCCVKDIVVKAAKLYFGEITGIIEYKESNTAVVNYTYVRKEITPFGRIAFQLTEGENNFSHTFTKYDDGWRITK